MAQIEPAGGLDQVKQSGNYWVRRNSLLWASVEPQPGQRNWEAVAALENELKNAANAGLQVILVVRSTPSWAQKTPGVACSAVSPEQLPAFALFMHDLVARYSVPPYQVKYWRSAMSRMWTLLDSRRQPIWLLGRSERPLLRGRLLRSDVEDGLPTGEGRRPSSPGGGGRPAPRLRPCQSSRRLRPARGRPRIAPRRASWKAS